MISARIAAELEHSSWIRRMFEEGARLRAERGAENVFDFSLGNPDAEPPAGMVAAIREEAATTRPGMHAYMPNAGYPAVREAVAAHVAASTGVPFGLDDIIMTVGSAGAINVVLRCVLDPGDEVIVLMPCFSEYPFYVTTHGGRMVPVETGPDFLPDLEKIEAALTARTRVLILNSPNNPTGRLYPAALLEELSRLLERQPNPPLVISDEPYKALVFDGLRPPEPVALIENSVLANSWSKSFAVPGQRIGYLAIPPRLRGAAELRRAAIFANRILGFINSPALMQRAVAAALDAPVDVERYQRRRDLLARALQRIGYGLVKPEGTFYLFPHTPVPDDLAFSRILVEEGVLAVPGTGFGRAGHMRLSLTIPTEVIERSVPAFERAFARCR
jgi:aspartate aminotransferase